jgi:CheY-like chemotaxis protein
MDLRVLIVEDEASVSDNLSAFLEDEGMDVTVVQSGEEAVASVEKGAVYDIAVVDIRLPGMNGISTITELNRLAPKMRYIVHTGSTSPTLRREVESVGVPRELIFYKPLGNMDALAATICQVVAEARQKDSHA